MRATAMAARLVPSLLLMSSPAVAAAQEVHPETAPDSAALALLERAREFRGREADGLDAYEALVRERLYIGLTADRFRRERALYRSERVARVRWESGGTETVRWLGIRRQVPIAGEAARIETDRPDELETYPLDPSGDRLQLGGSSFLHPLADTAGLHYRYTSGDTARIILPSVGREIVMAEIRFVPLRNDFRLLSGSLWFDLDSGALIRGVFRPSRPFNLERDEPEDAEDVPWFMKPIVVEVDLMVVEYGLFDLRWWLAHRVRFEGIARVGRLASLPVVLETVAEDVEVGGSRLDPAASPSPGWTRFVEHDGEPNDTDSTEAGRSLEPPPNRRIVYYPPDDTLRNSPWLLGDELAGASDAFTEEELDRLGDRLDELVVSRQTLTGSMIRVGAWRYNRVEALSGEVRAAAPVFPGWAVSGKVRLGVADRVPNAEISLDPPWAAGRFSLRGFTELRPAGDWGNPFALDASLSTLLLGYDDGHYLRAAGGELAYSDPDGNVRVDGRVFAEHQRAASKETDVSLANLLGAGDMRPNLVAERIDVFGVAGSLRLQDGLDPDDWIWTGGLWGEAATGDRDYARLAAHAGGSHPIAGRLAGAFQIRAGTTWGRVPTQRLWLLGGPATLRAFPGGSIRGPAFWLGRLEAAYGLPAVRLIAFTDVGWAGPRGEFWSGRPAMSAGLGASVLDGLLRIDVARVLRGRDPEHTRVHVYLDGLL